MARDRLTQARVRELFHYDDGRLIWAVDKSNIKAGTEAAKGHTGRGHKLVGIDGQNYSMHRVIFLWHHGFLPPEIDHANGDRFDNRIENLRAVTHAQNIWNIAAKGVSFCKQTGRWRATIYVGNRQRHIGRFDSESEARTAYLAAKEELHSIDGKVATCFR